MLLLYATLAVEAAVVVWLSFWLAEQEVRGSIPGLASWISEIGNLLLPSRDNAAIATLILDTTNKPTTAFAVYHNYEKVSYKFLLSHFYHFPYTKDWPASVSCTPLSPAWFVSLVFCWKSEMTKLAHNIRALNKLMKMTDSFALL